MKRSLSERITELLECPVCRGQLANDDGWRCMLCGTEYIVEDGIPILTPPGVDSFKRRESHFFSRGPSDEVATERSVHSPRVWRYHERYLTPLLAGPNAPTLLEVACGLGYDLTALASRGAEVVGVDIAPGSVRFAGRQIESAGRSGDSFLAVADGERLPFRNEQFDGVLIAASLHHLPRPFKCLTEMARCCKKGGVVVIGIEPNCWPYFSLFKVIGLLRRLVKLVEFICGRDTRNLREATEFFSSEGRALDDHSPGDAVTRGFTARRLREMAVRAGLAVHECQRVWYLSGLMQAVPGLGWLMNVSYGVQELIVHLDDALSRMPILNLLNWHWTVVCVKRA